MNYIQIHVNFTSSTRLCLPSSKTIKSRIQRVQWQYFHILFISSVRFVQFLPRVSFMIFYWLSINDLKDKTLNALNWYFTLSIFLLLKSRSHCNCKRMIYKWVFKFPPKCFGRFVQLKIFVNKRVRTQQLLCYCNWEKQTNLNCFITIIFVS